MISSHDLLFLVLAQKYLPGELRLCDLDSKSKKKSLKRFQLPVTHNFLPFIQPQPQHLRLEIMSQSSQVTPEVASMMPESSERVEKDTNKTEHSTTMSSQGTQQLEANVKSNTTEVPLQNDPSLDVPMNIELRVSVKKVYFLRNSRVYALHKTPPSFGLTCFRIEINVSKPLTAR